MEVTKTTSKYRLIRLTVLSVLVGTSFMECSQGTTWLSHNTLLHEALATHATAYRKEEGHGLALILVERRLCCTI